MSPPTTLDEESSELLGRPPRVLVVDDSARLRSALSDMLEQAGCKVVGCAIDGSMALHYAFELEPDVITLDLGMPRMDGFTFLRILQKTRNIPVIVVSANARPEAALMALELGARDVVVKPEHPRDLAQVRHQLVSRIRALAAERDRIPQVWAHPPDIRVPPDVALVAVGASTGGPRALRDLFSRIKPSAHAPILVAQHMPASFTGAFAARLARVSGLDAAEAHDGEVLRPGVVRVAPGGTNLVVEHVSGRLVLRCLEPQPQDRWVPSVDALLDSAARAVGPQLLAIVLTGMGRDGAEGARLVRAAGATMWTESSLTAVVDGMPAAAAQGHGAAERVPIDELAVLLARALEPNG